MFSWPLWSTDFHLINTHLIFNIVSIHSSFHCWSNNHSRPQQCIHQEAPWRKRMSNKTLIRRRRRKTLNMVLIRLKRFLLEKPNISDCELNEQIRAWLTGDRGWKKLTICLIVEAIALGSLSIPSVFAKTGMVAGVILCVSMGLIAIYTSYLVGQVKLKYPEIEHYADAVGLCWGKFGRELAGVMFVLLLVLLVGGQWVFKSKIEMRLTIESTLTGTIAFIRIVDKTTLCALIWTVVSAILLFVLALPPSFAEFVRTFEALLDKLTKSGHPRIHRLCQYHPCYRHYHHCYRCWSSQSTRWSFRCRMEYVATRGCHILLSFLSRHQHHLRIFFRCLSIFFHVRNAYTKRLCQINLGSWIDRNFHLHTHWCFGIFFRGQQDRKSCDIISRLHSVSSCLWNCSARWVTMTALVSWLIEQLSLSLAVSILLWSIDTLSEELSRTHQSDISTQRWVGRSGLPFVHLSHSLPGSLPKRCHSSTIYSA